MARNCSEAILQLDDQEQPIEMEQRRTIIEAVKKFSSLAKSSTSRIDFRKPFLPGLKSSNPVLQPWPSATNISRPVPFFQTPSRTSMEAGSSLKRDSFKCRQSSTEESDGPSVSSQGSYQSGVVNSAFAEERLHNVPDICDCDGAEEGHDALESDFSYQYQCRQADNELPILETIDNRSVIGDEPSRSRLNSCPKYLMTRSNRSFDSKKRNGIHWRSRISGEMLKFRRRTTDSIPKVSTILTPNRSSPNLSNLEEQMKTAPSVKTDPSCKQEDDSKL